MPTTYSPLKIALMATGENQNAWGDVTNANLGTALEEAIVGSSDVSFAGGNVTLTLTDTPNTQQARNLRLNLSGATAARELVVPAIKKSYIINNGNAHAITVKTPLGTGIVVPANKTSVVYVDGVNVGDAVTHLTSLTLASSLPVTSGGTGTTTSTGTGSVVLSNSPTLVTPTLGAASATSVAVSGAVTVGTTLGVTGASTLTGNTTVGGTLGVTGATTLSSTLGVAGASTLTGNTTVGGTLGVTGATTLSSTLTYGGVTLGAAVTGTGSMVLATSPVLVTPNLGVPSFATLTSATGLPIIAGTTGTLSVARGGTGATTLTSNGVVYGNGTGAVGVTAVGTDGQVLVGNTGGAPSWGAATGVAVTSINFGTTGLTPSTATQGAVTVAGTLAVANGGTGITSFGSGVATFLGTPSSANLLAALTTKTGTGLAVFGTSPTITSAVLVTPALGTPASGTLTSCDGLPIIAGTTGTLSVARGGTGATTLTSNGVVYGNGTSAVGVTAVGTDGQVLVGNTGGAPSWGAATGVAVTSINFGTTGLTPSTATQGAVTVAGTLAVANGGTGITSFGSGVATFLGTPSSANLAAAVTDKTGSGSLVFATSPVLVTPNLGVPSSGTLTSCTGLPLTTGVTGTLPVANGGTGVTTSTGSGNNVLSTSPTLVTPILGTPQSGTLTNCTGLPNAAVVGLGALATLSTVGTSQIDNDSVTFTKTQNIATARLLGRTTAGSGDIEELTASQSKSLLAIVAADISDLNTAVRPLESIIIALSDEVTPITVGNAKVTMRMPYAFTLTSVKASLSTASSSGIPTVDINESGTTILSTKLTIDAGEKTSTTAAVPVVISDSSLADDSEITFDIDVAGTGATGLKVTFIGRRT